MYGGGIRIIRYVLESELIRTVKCTTAITIQTVDGAKIIALINRISIEKIYRIPFDRRRSRQGYKPLNHRDTSKFFVGLPDLVEAGEMAMRRVDRSAKCPRSIHNGRQKNRFSRPPSIKLATRDICAIVMVLSHNMMFYTYTVSIINSNLSNILGQNKHDMLKLPAWNFFETYRMFLPSAAILSWPIMEECRDGPQSSFSRHAGQAAQSRLQ